MVTGQLSLAEDDVYSVEQPHFKEGECARAAWDVSTRTYPSCHPALHYSGAGAVASGWLCLFFSCPRETRDDDGFLLIGYRV